MKYLGTMTYRQVEQYREKTNMALLPVGATEAHGPHLPLKVDSVTAEEIAERAAEQLLRNNIDVLIAPAIHYAVADTSHSFAGNITLSFETLAGLIEDICSSLCKWGFNRIMIISGHGEQKNRQAIAEGLKRAQVKNEHMKAAISKWFAKGLPALSNLCLEEHPQWDYHAGEWETALILLRHPEYVDREELQKLEPNWEGQFLLERTAEGKKDWLDLGAPLAYFGDPRKAREETAEKVYDLFAEIVTGEVMALAKKD